MTGASAKTIIWRALLVISLCFALLLPALAPVLAGQTDQDHVHGASEHAHRHDQDSSGLPHDCHPGLDCHFQALVTVQDMPRLERDADTISFASATKAHTGKVGTFDPPPPRGVS